MSTVKFIKRVFMLIGGLVVALVVIGMVTNSGSASKSASAGQAAAQAQPVAHAQEATPPPAPLGVGDTGQNGKWAVKLDDVHTAAALGDSFASTDAQGKFVVATLTLTNHDSQTQPLNDWDFQMVGPDGAKFKTSSEGTTASLSGKVKPLYITQNVQPGLSKQVEVIFDVAPGQDYTLQAAGNNFQVSVA
jgi:hypothetical protein